MERFITICTICTILLGLSTGAHAAKCSFNFDIINHTVRIQHLIRDVDAYIFPTTKAQDNFHKKYNVVGWANFAFDFGDDKKRGAIKKHSWSNKEWYILPSKKKRIRIDRNVKANRKYPVTIRYNAVHWYTLHNYVGYVNTVKAFCNAKSTYKVDI